MYAAITVPHLFIETSKIPHRPVHASHGITANYVQEGKAAGPELVHLGAVWTVLGLTVGGVLIGIIVLILAVILKRRVRASKNAPESAVELTEISYIGKPNTAVQNQSDIIHIKSPDLQI